MEFNVICSKGTDDYDNVTITESDVAGLRGKKLSDLRDVLEKKQVNGQSFICTDDSNSQYRFVMPKAEKCSENYSDRIVARTTERFIPLADMFINEQNQIILTNTKKLKKPDLIGFAADCWAGGKLQVKCRLKKSDESTRTINNDKFEPIMLTNVVPTNENLQLYYDNVCICCEDSVVEFPLRCYGTVGFEFKASIASGEVIRGSAVHWTPYDKNLYGETIINAWRSGNEDRNIVLKAIDHVSGIDPATKMQYQKVSFIARDMLAWKDGDAKVVYNANSQKMKLESVGGISFLNELDLNIGDTQIAIDGSDIKPATPVKGDKTKVCYGNWSVVESKPWEEPQGIVNVYFFVFSSKEKAKQYIDRYNILPPSMQEEIWR